MFEDVAVTQYFWRETNDTSPTNCCITTPFVHVYRAPRTIFFSKIHSTGHRR